MKINILFRKGMTFTIIFMILSLGIVTSSVSEDKHISKSTLYRGINYICYSKSNINSKHLDYLDYKSILPVTFDNGWNIEIVDSEFNVGLYSSLALDSNDSPHILYYDGHNCDLKYAFMNGSEWTVKLLILIKMLDGRTLNALLLLILTIPFISFTSQLILKINLLF